jgi:hypothetical protein
MIASLPDTSAPGDGSNSSSSAGSVAWVDSSPQSDTSVVLTPVVQLQQDLLQLLYRMRPAGSADAAVLDAVLASDSSAEAALQLLCAYTHLMYDEHTAAAAAAAGAQQRQQRRLGGDLHGLRPGGASSSTAAVPSSSSGNSSSGNSSIRRSSACAPSFRWPVQAGVLPISPVHEQLELPPAAWQQQYLQAVQKAAASGSMDCLLTHVKATLHVLSRHMFLAGTALEEQQQTEQQQQQQQQQQKEHYLAANNTPEAAAPAPPRVVAGAAAAAAAAANAPAPECAASCALVSCPVPMDHTVLLVIEALQLLAAMSEQGDQQFRYDCLDAYSYGALLLHRQLVVLQRCSALRGRHINVVHQSVQQLMQLMRWQLQLAGQRSTPPHGADASAWEEVVDSISDLAEQALFCGLVGRYSGECLLLNRRCSLV